MYHPWRAFRDFTHYRLRFAPLPIGVLGLTDFTRREVVLAPDLYQSERRSTIAHEVEHLLDGAPCHGRGECLIEARAARKLIPIRELGEALAWDLDLDTAAEELWVDRQMLEARLRHLHPSEYHYLRDRLDHHRPDVHAEWCAAWGA